MLKILSIIRSASKFRAHFGQPLEEEEIISPQSRHGIRFMVPPLVASKCPYLLRPGLIHDGARTGNLTG